jgi:hypothetical protein
MALKMEETLIGLLLAGLLAEWYGTVEPNRLPPLAIFM